MLNDVDIDRLFRLLQQHSGTHDPGPNVKAQADHFRALVACLLSAQSRDANTAKARDALFALADTPHGLLALSDPQVAAAIKPAGLYNMKAKRIRALCHALLENHNGVVPQDRTSLMALPGIGRKCADIMLQFSFGTPTIAVDTHIHRVCNRTGLAIGRTEAQTAAHLAERAPAWALAKGHVWLLGFGKKICRARAPRCAQCYLKELCENPVKV